VAFGEECLGKFAVKGPSHDERGKLGSRWFKGVFLGYDRLTAEYVLYTQGKVVKTRALQRRAEGSRWNGDALEEVKTSPYALYRRPDAEVVFQHDPSARRQAAAESKKIVVRDINLRQEDFAEHGMTQNGCSRCNWAIRYGWEMGSSLSHSEECRVRMREAIRGSGPAGKARVEAWEDRKRKATAANEPDVSAEGEKQDCDRDAEDPYKFEDFVDGADNLEDFVNGAENPDLGAGGNLENPDAEDAESQGEHMPVSPSPTSPAASDQGEDMDVETKYVRPSPSLKAL
jgi:hypothetical protein